MTTTTTLYAPARARLAPPAPKADLAEIRAALDLLAVPGGIVEIRALDVPAGAASLSLWPATFQTSTKRHKRRRPSTRGSRLASTWS